MENQIKISLTIELEGSVLLNEEPEVITNFKSKSKNIKKREKFSFRDIKIKTKPAHQHINMTKQAYLYFISNETPEWAKAQDWRMLSQKERLERHLAKTCEHFRGKSFTYTILED